jgi:hypothetical protein
MASRTPAADPAGGIGADNAPHQAVSTCPIAAWFLYLPAKCSLRPIASTTCAGHDSAPQTTSGPLFRDQSGRTIIQ